jgi:OTU domain-containing protein 3
LKRALADQLEGSPNNHHIYREKICDYIAQHRDLFEPFIEDDVPFEEVIFVNCISLRKLRTKFKNLTGLYMCLLILLVFFHVFSQYLTQMRKNATWGGNIEIQAASLLFHVNISIYQLGRVEKLHLFPLISD